MNRTFPAHQHHEALRRLAVMLLALAALAERAALRSGPIRYVVLWLLRPAEVAALTFATEAGCAKSLIGAEYSGSCTHQATRLVRIFRALAAAFFVLARRASRLIRAAGRQRFSCPLTGVPNAARLCRLLAASLPRYPDSS